MSTSLRDQLWSTQLLRTGIWTKHLKAKTNLHQTVIDRCLKTLVQKRLIKRVPSVQHPTRKIYMLEGLEPSIALTGGPWYTDNELDTEFIQNLTEACYKFISDLVSISTNQNYSHSSAPPSQSFPKRKEGAPGALYPISNAPQYPTAQHIRNSLRKARLTETDLTVEHVEMLLNVLVLDGKIEKVSSTPPSAPLALIQTTTPASSVRQRPLGSIRNWGRFRRRWRPEESEKAKTSHGR